MIAIYARQSVEKEDSISIESQIEMCTYEARGEAFLVYKDKGFSGKNTNRPEFQRMMQDIKTGQKGITKVIVYKLDRISRSILDFSNMMDIFGKLGVEFSSATEKFDTSTPMGRAMLNICITFAQLERETTQQRVKDNYISRSQKGFYMGGPVPVGFKKADLTIDGIKTSMYEQIPDEVRLVKKVFEMYADVNYSNEDIAKAVRDMPPECRRNRTVTRARVQDFIKNPVYVKADINVYNFFKSKGVKIINPPEDFIGTNGCYLYTGDKKTRKQTDLSNAVLVLAPQPDARGRRRAKPDNARRHQHMHAAQRAVPDHRAVQNKQRRKARGQTHFCVEEQAQRRERREGNGHFNKSDQTQGPPLKRYGAAAQRHGPM